MRFTKMMYNIQGAIKASTIHPSPCSHSGEEVPHRTYATPSSQHETCARTYASLTRG